MDLVFESIRKGDQSVFKSFFEKNYEDLVIYANGFLFDQDSSQDLVQEVFIYIWENAKSIDIQVSLKSYSYTMVRNRCFNFLKTIKITDDYELLDLALNLVSEHEISLSDEDERKILNQQVSKALTSLPDRMQEIVKLKYLNNYKYSEIALELNISVNTVKTQLKRAKLKIAEIISILAIMFESHQ